VSNKTETGTVKWFDENKGFGFIERDGGGSDAFAHYLQIFRPKGDRNRRNLQEGQRVTFQIEDRPKGPAAIDIRAAQQ
jgi:CspA family cold shock protein